MDSQPSVTKLASQITRLEKVVDLLHRRVLALEKENKKLRGRLGRTAEHVGFVERQAATRRS